MISPHTTTTTRQMLLSLAWLPVRWAVDAIADVRSSTPLRQRCPDTSPARAPKRRQRWPAEEPWRAVAAAARAWMDRSMESLVLLWVLYFVQGLPFGFQSKSLPLLLRERGFTLRHIGYANLLSVPWTCKFLISPFVDRWGASSRWGRRKAWIFPMQFCLIVACLAAAYNYESLEFLMPIILMMNICTATMDVAVDGLALDVLNGENELGWGNVAQTVGYKMGMIIGGGVLLQVAEMTGMAWPGFFVCMAGICALSMIPLAMYDETAKQTGSLELGKAPFGDTTVADEYHEMPIKSSMLKRENSKTKDDLDKMQKEAADELERTGSLRRGNTPPKETAADTKKKDADDDEEDLTFAAVTGTLWKQIHAPGGLVTLTIVFSYKIGEAVSDNMFKPYLLDQGFTKSDISMWTGVYGMGFSTAGSLAGGFVVRKMVERAAKGQPSAAKPPVLSAPGGNTVLLSAVTLASAFEAVAQLGRLGAACVASEVLASANGRLALQALIMYESFCGGLLTTIIFTYMMASVDKSIGATHYSMLSTVELAGKSIPSIMSGLLAETVGYRAVFGIGAMCSVLFVIFSLYVNTRAKKRE